MGADGRGSQVGRKKRATGEPPKPADPRGWLKVGLAATAMLLVGLVLTVGSITFKRYLAEKADRLRSEGIPVAAAQAKLYNGSGRGSGVDTVDVSYFYRGEYYQASIRCGGFTGCHSTPSEQTTVWIDPDDPAQFVAENGHTDDSVSFLNGFTPIPAGVLFTVLGAAGLVVTRLRSRQAARRRTASNRGDGQGGAGVGGGQVGRYSTSGRPGVP
ncbi:DUF3592 domain-containing protein [Micromonospora sp. NPDC049523]|uniref:DUF3592 domain-containing protein n=1 Tax=Micromonospora sp. NPDC049523 TaxID=3155921 RepID=UPI00343F2CB8